MKGKAKVLIRLLVLVCMTGAAIADLNASESKPGVADNAVDMLLKELREIKEQMALYRDKSEMLEERIEKLERENEAKDIILEEMFGTVRDLTLQTNNTQRLLTESHNSRSKRQAMSRIAFSAYLSRTDYHMVPGQPIKFDRVLLNDGAAYNSYTGAFTAPISGTYLFSFHFQASRGTFVRLNVDGQNQVDAVANPHTNTQNIEVMSGNTAIIHVGVGQSVLVEVFDAVGDVDSSDKYRMSTFSGVFLYPEIV